MVVHKRKKHFKFRGHRMQGYGSHKKHRGGGSRGGRGMAGMHKHKWSYTVKYGKGIFGKHGFKPQNVAKELPAVNLRYLDENAERLLNEKLAAKYGDATRINVTKLGFGKVLGGGQLQNKLIVEAQSFSEEAKKKIEEAGGQALIAEKKKAAVKEKVGEKAGEKVEEKVAERKKEVKVKKKVVKKEAKKKK